MAGNFIIGAFKLISGFKKERKRQINTVNSMINEIKTIIVVNSLQRKTFGMAFSNGLFAQRISADEAYFPYIASADRTNVVFQTEIANLDFLRTKCFNSLVKGYDTFSLLQSSLIDCRSDAFRTLKPDRKLSALGQIDKLYKQTSKEMIVGIQLLKCEAKRLSPRWAEKNLLRIKARV